MRINNYVRISLLIFIIAIAASCSDKSDRSKLGLNGAVESLTVSNFIAEFDNGEWQKVELMDSSKIFFDKNGWQQTAKYYDSDGYLSQEVVIKRKAGRVVEQSIFNAEGDLTMRDEYAYNSKDTVETITYDSEGEVLLKLNSVYDNDLMVKQIVTNIEEEEKDSEFVIEYEYDEAGNEIYKEWSDEEMQQFSVVKSEYNDKNNLLYKEVDDIALESVSQTEYEYLSFDSKDNWTKRLEYVSYSDTEEKGEYTILSIRTLQYY